jgi:hypothetical protein
MVPDNLYALAEARGMTIDNFTQVSTGSISIAEPSGACYIAVDERALGTRANLNVHLAHELGHCETGSFYYADSPCQCREKLEYRANAWAYRRVTPPEAIQAALDDGIRAAWELAEWFGVTDEFVAEALRYYTERRGIVFSVE